MESDHPENLQDNNDSVFVWDESSQLYFHASSGFYHDPSAGWYYSSKDGLYYKFEDGNYVLINSNDADDGETFPSNDVAPHDPALPGGSCQQIYGDNDEIYSTIIESTSECHQQMGTVADEVSHAPMDSSSSPTSEKLPPPPSEWLEDTLIDLYLSGHNNPAVADTEVVPLETDDGAELAADGAQNNSTYELEEGEWIPDDENGIADTIIGEDEKKWCAQYGQVIDSGKEVVPGCPVVDLWEWEMVRGFQKDGKDGVARLVGRLVKRSTRLHPSMPSGGGKLRSAPICETHLDLIRVKTGQVYKLRNPSASYLASLSTYDSANPTKEWGFPPLSSDWKITHISKYSESSASSSVGVCKEQGLPVLPPNQLASSKQRSCQYRDRAAERRMLHGAFSVGPGQKNTVGGDNDTLSSPVSNSPQEAAAEAMEMSFGTGSYARKILKSMGWKEGEKSWQLHKRLVGTYSTSWKHWQCRFGVVSPWEKTLVILYCVVFVVWYCYRSNFGIRIVSSSSYINDMGNLLEQYLMP